MKKNYIAPCTEQTFIELQQMIAASGVTGKDGAIGYGGVDDGTHEPASRRRSNSQWDDEEEEEY